jgi:hypothetical protein
MKFIEDHQGTVTQCMDVHLAEYAGDFKIHIVFSDEFSNVVDFKPFLKRSFHPSIRKYLDEVLFQQFEVRDGNINWNDYDMIFPIEDLYAGKI